MTVTDRPTAQDYLSLATHYERAAEESTSSTERVQLQTIANTYAALAESTAVLTRSERVTRGLRTSQKAR